MKSILFSLFILFPVFSWSQMIPVSGEQVPVALMQPLSQSSNNELQSINQLPPSTMDEIIGITQYDFQTNASMMNRLVNLGDGRLAAVWTMGLDQPAFPDRGTGYNYFDGTQWGEVPDTRIENVRTGWPSIVVTEEETEFIVSHDFAQSTLVTSRRVPGQIEWDQSTIPTDVPVGLLWPQMAAGKDNFIHLIAITGQQVYEGVEGHLLYYRSSDAGLTWEVQDFIVPGLDSTSYRDYRQADSYQIAARGNTIAIAKFSMWEDVVVFRSDDNGDNWTKSVVYDFPIENYIEDTGYTTDDLPVDDFAPSELAIYSSGNSGNIIIDNNNNLHLFFNSLYVSDEILGNFALEYYPCTNGIAYWKESMGENSLRIIASAVDVNQNGFLDFECDPANFSHRFSSLTTAPNAGVDEDNNLYLTYSAATEEFLSLTAFPAIQHYTHIYAIRSPDGGDSWSSPRDLIKETVNPAVLSSVNADYPAIALDVDEQMHILYQQDFEPGNNIADGDPHRENRMVYISYDLADFDVLSNENLPLAHNGLQLSPNPAKDVCTLEINPEWSKKAVLNISDAQGRIIYTNEQFNTSAQATYQLPISIMPKGIYAVQVLDGSANFVGKLVVE